MVILFVFLGYGVNRDLHSFPTRRSSDLRGAEPADHRRADRRGDMVIAGRDVGRERPQGVERRLAARSEEHTSELQSHSDLVCRLLLEKKKRYTAPTSFR